MRGLKALDLVPTHRKPVKAKEALRRFAVGLETAIAHDASPNEVHALAAASNFPGGVSSQAPRGEHMVTIDTAVPGWHSLGLYAPPGEKVTVTLAQEGRSTQLDGPDRLSYRPALAPEFVGAHSRRGAPVPDWDD